MSKGLFKPSEFTPTQWSSAKEKADFANTLLRFIEAGWKPTMFTKKLYKRLSMCFGNIAHYNLTGFYEEWFTTETDRLRFLEHLLRWPCHGQPAFTFCDVERAIQDEIRARGWMERQRQRAANETRTTELQILARLEQKYRGSSSDVGCIPAAAETSQTGPPTQSPHHPMQGSLF